LVIPYVASAIGEALGLSYVTALDLPMRALGACAGHPTTAAPMTVILNWTALRKG
jgi:hypothetical protein